MRHALFLLLVYVGIAAAQPTAKFPTAAATWADLLQAKDNSRSTLSAPIDNSTLSVPVVDGAKFTAWQAVLIENEKLLVCSVSSNTLTICATGRGWGGTGAASHTSGLAVIGLNFQEHHNGLAAEIAAIEAALGPNLSNVQSNGVFTSNVTFTPDNTYDIGATAASRPRDVFLGRNLAVGNYISALGTLYLGTGQSRVAGNADGVIALYNNGGSDFSRLQFGGTSNAFPAWKRSGTTLEARLADDSGAAPISTSYLAVGASGNANLTLQGGGSAKYWITMQTPANGNKLLIGGNGGTEPAAGAINIDGTNVGFGGKMNPGYAVDVTGDVNVSGNFRVAGVPFTGGVTSVFTRTGAVTAQTGDYTAAQVTNAVSTAGSYTDPSWLTINWSKVSAKPSTFVYTDGGPYSDPSWLTLTKGKVGLGSVENTALSTWAGSANITTLGTIASGTVPWARLSSVPTTFTPAAHTHPVADLSTVGDYSSKITSGTYSIGITGNAGTVGGLAVSGTSAPGANQIIRSDGNSYVNLGWINTVSGDNGTAAISRVYASGDGYIRYYTLGNFTKQVVNNYTHDASFAWDDPYIALPTGQVMQGVFTARAAQATITEVWCWADTSDAVINLRRSDGGDMINGNLTCTTGAATSTNINGYGAIPVGYSTGLYYISGTAKQIRVGIKYTTAY